MKEENKILLGGVLAVIALLVIAGLGCYSIVYGSKMTGYATVIGYANLSITQTANLNFTTNSITFGSGIVLPLKTGTVMNSEGMYSATNQSGFNNVTAPLVLENIGNTNVSLTLNSSLASQFIGGTSPSYKLKITEKTGNQFACATNGMSAYTEVTGLNQSACGRFGFDDNYDEIEIDVQLYLPYNAPYGDHLATITAVGTGI